MFLFCVRRLGTADPILSTLKDTISDANRSRELQCVQPPPALTSTVNDNDLPIDFSRPIFLGIPNPMEFPVTVSEWEVSG